jgi:hypothetical protein
MLQVVLKMRSPISKYSPVFNRVGPGYGGFEKFVIVDQYVGFPGERYNFSFTDVEFCILAVSTTQTLYIINV